MVYPKVPPEEEKDSETNTIEPQVVITGPRAERDPIRYSPEWSPTTKLVIGLTLAAMSAILLLRFLNIVGPLLLAFILAYLFYPLAGGMSRALRIPWRTSVSILYLLLLVVVIGAIAAGGLALVEQVQSLIGFLQSAIKGLPGFIETIVSNPIQFGPFIFRPDTLQLDVNTLTQQILSTVQPLLTGAGTLVTTFASRAAEVVGWMFFILLISYFVLGESGGSPNRLINLDIPGYAEDLQRIYAELSRIWNAFLRGQLIIVLMTILVYIFLLGGLGLKFFIGLALLAGLARFVPYVGPAVAWTTYGLVAFFQGSTIFGISPLGYVGVVVGTAWVMDMVLDNFVVPRLMSDALRVHPAAVMVSALIGANLLGVIGVVLAAPVLATLMLFLDYVISKLFDRNPWENMKTMGPPASLPSVVTSFQRRYQDLIQKMNNVRLPWMK